MVTGHMTEHSNPCTYHSLGYDFINQLSEISSRLTDLVKRIETTYRSTTYSNSAIPIRNNTPS